LYNAFQEQNRNSDNHWKLHHRAYKARELNSPDGDFALLRLKQGIILVNIDRKFWQDGNWDSLKKIWKFNLTCLTFLKAKRLGLTFQSLQKPWALH
ncbi:35892_t:CDS:2, partial [Gigaspora margarita]